MVLGASDESTVEAVCDLLSRKALIRECHAGVV